MLQSGPAGLIKTEVRGRRISFFLLAIYLLLRLNIVSYSRHLGTKAIIYCIAHLVSLKSRVKE